MATSKKKEQAAGGQDGKLDFSEGVFFHFHLGITYLFFIIIKITPKSP